MEEHSGWRIYQKILQAIDLRSKDVLEIGCGDGRISSLLSGRPKSLIAIDPDGAKIERAARGIPGVDFRLGTGEDLDFPDDSFDVVIFTLSLHHQDSYKAIGEACRVLRKGGSIIVVEPRVEGEVERVFALLHDENAEKRWAQRSIAESGLTVAGQEIFTAEWIFRDRDDLMVSIFDHYDMAYDHDIADRVDALLEDILGDRTEKTPIVLQDLMIIQSLEK